MTGLASTDIYSERGKTQFIAARYAAAAADLEQSLTLGSVARAGDVLWFPYQAAWLHIARARAGQNDAEELARNAGKIDLKQWPGTMIAFFPRPGRTRSIAAAFEPRRYGPRTRVQPVVFFRRARPRQKRQRGGYAAIHARARSVQHPHLALPRRRGRIEAPGEIASRLKQPAKRAAPVVSP